MPHPLYRGWGFFVFPRALPVHASTRTRTSKNDPATAAPAINSILYCDAEKQLVRDAR